MKVFGERLRCLRTEKKFSAKQLAEHIGVSDAAIINWENNVNDIKGEYLIEIAKFFGVTTDYLLGLEE